MRKLTVSRAFLYRNAQFKDVEAPFIRVQGKWLEVLGFTAGSKVEVVEKPGEITIRLMEEGGCHGKG
ncbi:SymE family type I addiction module toxin [Cohnella luojiensis]|uniref:Type I addiction module toxin, SymE family n=1 Tax=Cohnella luojiensis TaxID=652876 RepID=A0A4Y8LMM6_9BACL|nr:SymE family type I addiction module toxin [Cohnella luojiensis]TFE19292.1 type I addiction module toxin, SymE family [Cohnella luojiensis]